MRHSGPPWLILAALGPALALLLMAAPAWMAAAAEPQPAQVALAVEHQLSR